MSSVTSPRVGSQVPQDSDTANANTVPVIITPSTPPRGRKPSRYPSTLSIGDASRVPLHRRGTSKTYERLEDLLREAGYKETRIFTPETERAEARAEERRKQEAYNDGQRNGSGRSGVGVVMDFLSGWMAGANKQDDEHHTDSESGADDSLEWRRSLPSSPLAHKRVLDSDDSGSPLASPPFPSPSPSFGSPPIPGHQSLDLLRSHHALPHPRVLLHQPSSAGSLRTYAQVSAARGYLRHMASAPNVAKARSSPGMVKRSSTADSDIAPPLPSRWLESVTKAVLGSSTSDAHIGGPPPPRPSSRQSHRTFRSTAQNSTLSDRTNRRPRPPPLNRQPHSAVPPAALTATYLHPPQTASISVTPVRVVCRSAPASRSSSRVGERLAMPSDRPSILDRSGIRPRSAKSPRVDMVPSLTSTQLENDETWAAQWMDGVRVHNASDDDDDDHDDDDEGEIDLARLLVPAKRQHSIRSLRRHLHRSESARALRSPDQRAFDPWAPEDEGAGGGKKSQSLRGRSKRNSLDDDEGHGYGWEAIGVPGFDQVGSKRRRAIPGRWSNVGSSTGTARA
ncbi:hypothetical protein EIP91_009888 [Steccherinum ochraceum]|uniref:Uncharacterized protein n=1 Tax=Steccherinum ochraceum TaxID=92696 RepID=A0A4R0RNG2_9APHY|nr:hypothetical protein EIP91_009888 [Steccherinum ochraceum]